MSQSTKKKLVVYDLDGTLVDTAEDITRAANHMIKEMGRRALSREAVSRFVGKGLHHLIKSCLGTENPKEIERGAKIYRAYYAAHMMDHSRLYPGVRECLDYFSGRSQAVVTNKPNPFSRELLEALGVAGYFMEIVAGDSGYSKKPSPEAFFSLMKKAGAGAGETLFIGDSPVDIETGRNAGVVTWVVSHGFSSAEELKCHTPDALFNNFHDLIRWAGKKGW